MPNTVKIKKLIRREPSNREDYAIKQLRKMGLLPQREQKVYSLPKAPGVFSLGPDIEPVQVPNDEVLQPIVNFDATELSSLKEGMRGLF